MKAHLQKGRVKAGLNLTLPAAAQNRVNQANDKRALDRAFGQEPTAPEPTAPEPTAETKPDDMTVLDGVDEDMAKKLYGVGYNSYEQLAKADWEVMTKSIVGMNEDLAKSIIEKAKIL